MTETVIDCLKGAVAGVIFMALLLIPCVLLFFIPITALKGIDEVLPDKEQEGD